MRPPLGSRSPETRHLNLTWTVRAIDRVAFMRRNAGLTAEEIATKLHGTMYQCGPGYIQRLAAHFRVTIEPSIYERASR